MSQPGDGTDGIEHVVLLMMENHSFDQMLGCLDEVHPDLDGIRNAAAKTNDDGRGTVFRQQQTDEKQVLLDPHHDHTSVLRQIADDNSGFVRVFTEAYPKSTPLDRQYVMGYYEKDFLPALHALGEHFTVCDRWFSSLPGPTWPNRFFALSGTCMGEVDMPSGTQGLNPKWYTEQDQDTIFDRLDAAGKPWTVYFYDFPSSLLLTHQRAARNLGRYEFIAHFFQQAAGDEPDFPAFAFIEPRYFGEGQNDDHPPHNTMKAEKLIADTYNALRSNPDLWAKTLLVVVYDEHGGFYDHVPPPTGVAAPDAHTEAFDFTQLGVRVPALLISPWCDARVEHTQFDHTSLLKYLCDKWDMAPLGERTRTANSIATAIRVTGEPRVADTPPFIRVPNTSLIPDDARVERDATNANADGLHRFADWLRAQTNAVSTDVVEALAVDARAWTRFKHRVGTRVIAFGDWLDKDFVRQRRSREARTAATVGVVRASIGPDRPA
jgi:phospholipase C